MSTPINPTRSYAPTSAGSIAGASLSYLYDGKPFFSYMDVPRINRDPWVSFLKQIWVSPLRQVRWKVRATSQAVASYVDRTVKRFWRSTPGIMRRYFDWGFAPGGVEYREKRGRWLLDTVRPIESFDARVLVHLGGERKGDLAGFETVSTGPVLRPYAFWFAGRGELGRYYDRPPVANLYDPWLEKNERGGALQLRHLLARKHAIRPAVGKHPAGEETWQLPGGGVQTISRQQLMLSALEMYESGANIALEAEYDEHGNPLWSIEPAAAGPDIKGVADYVDALDIKMGEAVGLPAEVVRAAATGSGFSGRSIPYKAWLGGCDEYVLMLIDCFDRNPLRGMVHRNFGPRADYEIEPISLVQDEQTDGQGQGHSEGEQPAAAAKPKGPPETIQEPDDEDKKPEGDPFELSAASVQQETSKSSDALRQTNATRFVMLAMLRLQAKATAEGDAHKYDQAIERLAELAGNPDDVRAILEGEHDGVDQFDMAWAPYLSKRKTKGGDRGIQIGWVDDATGRVVYGKQKPGARREKAKADIETAHDLLEKITAGGPEEQAAHLRALADHLPALSLQKIREIRAKLNGTFGGQRSRADGMVDALAEHFRLRANSVESENAPDMVDHRGRVAEARDLKAAKQFQPAKREGLEGAEAAPDTGDDIRGDELATPPPPGTVPPARPDGTPVTTNMQDVYTVPVASLKVNPARFQYKVEGVGKKGVTSQFKDTDVWNPSLGGVLLVWRDPADGQDYVINGHHRHELADRLNAQSVNVRYLQSPNESEARAEGALANMAEGKGTAFDAAKFLRDTGGTVEMLRAKGIPLRDRLANDAIALSKLSPKAFADLNAGRITTAAAVQVATHLKDHKLQDKLFEHMEGKRWTPEETEIAAKRIAAAGKTTVKTSNLFGDFEDEESTFDQEVELEAYVRSALSRQARDFAAASDARRNELLAKHGNNLDTETNQGLRDQATQVLDVFDQHAHLKGPISAAMNEMAAKLKVAKTKGERDAIKQNTLAAVEHASKRVGTASEFETDAGTVGPGDRPSEASATTGPGANQSDHTHAPAPTAEVTPTAEEPEPTTVSESAPRPPLDHQFPSTATSAAFPARTEFTPDGKAIIRQASNGQEVVSIPANQHDRFLDEINGRISGNPTSGHPSVDAVLSGKGKFLGKGHEGQAFDAGDGQVVKAAAITPFHWNNGVRSDEEANAGIKKQADNTNAMIDAGVPGLLPQKLVHHEGRSYAVMPKVDTNAPLTAEHIGQLDATLAGMHKAGYRLQDEVQAGVGPDGRAAIYDTGSAQKSDGQPGDESTERDFGNLAKLAKQHGVAYQTPAQKSAVGQYESSIEEANKAISSGAMTKAEALRMRNRLKRLRNITAQSDPDHHEITADEYADTDRQLAAIMKGKQPEPAAEVPVQTEPAPVAASEPAQAEPTPAAVPETAAQPEPATPPPAVVPETTAPAPVNPQYDPVTRNMTAPHEAGLEKMAPGSQSYIGGYLVTRQANGQFNISQDKKTFLAGDAAKVAGFIRDQWAKHQRQIPRVAAALQRAGNYTDAIPMIQQKQYDAEQRKLQAIPLGAMGVSTAEGTYGRIGRIAEHPELGRRLSLDDTDEMGEHSLDYEPLDPHYSWRAGDVPLEAPKRIQTVRRGLFDDVPKAGAKPVEPATQTTGPALSDQIQAAEQPATPKVAQVEPAPAPVEPPAPAAPTKEALAKRLAEVDAKLAWHNDEAFNGGGGLRFDEWEKLNGESQQLRKQIAELSKPTPPAAAVDNPVDNSIPAPVAENAPATPPNVHNAEMKIVEKAGKKEKLLSWPFRRDVEKRIHEGTISAAELRQHFDALTADPATTKAHLAEVLKKTGMRSPTKIAETADAIYDRALSTLTPGQTVSYQVPLGRGLEAYHGAKIAAHKKAAHALTDEDLKAYADSRKQAQADYDKAMTNPETPEELQRFVDRKGEAALSPDQLAKWDEHKATTRRANAQASREQAAKLAPISTDGTGFEIHQGMHTKHNKPIHIVKLNGRVDGETFRALNEAARKLGGSGHQPNARYTRGASPDGFNFDTAEQAERFSKLLGGESVSRVPDWDAAKSESQQATAERLRGLADRTEENATDVLGQDRKTNTRRRAAQASSTEGSARANQAFAGTVRRVADAIGEGKATHLAGIRAGTQLRTLDTILRRSIYQHDRANDIPWHKTEGRDPTAADIDHAEYPYPLFHQSDLIQLAGKMRDTPGAKRLGERLRKWAETMKTEDRENAHVKSEDLLGHLADVARNPSAYGLDRFQGDMVKYKMDDYMRLQAADIRTPHELRAALREYLPLKQKPKGEDPIKAAERKLIGKPIPGFFPTPRPAIDEMLDRADIQPGHKVLEPSAGKGDILDAIKERHPDAEAHGLELNNELHGILQAKGHEAEQGNFLDMKPRDFHTYGDTFRAPDGAVGIMRGHPSGTANGRIRLVDEDGKPVGSQYYDRSALTPVKQNGTRSGYDRIVMNPPFENGQDMAHVQHAYEHLKPGGRMVAITSEGPFSRSDSKSQAFRDWLDSVGGVHEQMPEGSFAGPDAFRQTGVRTRMVTIDKPHAGADQNPDQNPDQNADQNADQKTAAPLWTPPAPRRKYSIASDADRGDAVAMPTQEDVRRIYDHGKNTGDWAPFHALSAPHEDAPGGFLVGGHHLQQIAEEDFGPQEGEAVARMPKRKQAAHLLAKHGQTSPR